MVIDCSTKELSELLDRIFEKLRERPLNKAKVLK